MTTAEMTYTDYIRSLNDPNQRQMMIELEGYLNSGEITPSQFYNQVEVLTGKKVTPIRAYNGDVLAYNLTEVSTSTKPNPVNSNATSIVRGTVSQPIKTTVGQTGKTVAQTLRGIGSKSLVGVATIGAAAGAVATGISLGKVIDGALYNAFPDFFNSNDTLAHFNPETWSTLTAGDDSLGAGIINALLGIDPDTGESQMYIDQNAMAYFAAYMQAQGVFEQQTEAIIDGEVSGITFPGEIPTYTDTLSTPIITSQGVTKYIGSVPCYVDSSGNVSYLASNVQDEIVYISASYYTDTRIFLSSEAPVHISGFYRYDAEHGYWIASSSFGAGNKGSTYEGKTAYYTVSLYNLDPKYYSLLLPVYNGASGISSNDYYSKFPWITVYGDKTLVGGVDGITNQEGATTPNLNSSDIPTVLAALQNQYPDLWQNAIDYPVVQPDGSVKNYTYVPVAMPDFLNRTDNQPTSGTASQANPEVNPSTFTQEQLQQITDLFSNPYPQTKEDLDRTTPPSNPTDTGDGSSPTPVAPTGSASSLWAIYHPTQAQIDSFGSWLWSADFVEQIKKIFNNPMESIIGLHKVYATPVDAGTATIKVGYLDSQVPSAYITQQYITVDCGSIELGEQFANVFDYSPFTLVKLYLPFIGIVPLDVADVMRSTISITYGVDVLTGACLASVSVSRDLNDSVLYQYSGNCAVQYPISSGSYMGIVAGIVSIAGGIAATVATGGGAAPIALGAAGAAFNAHTDVQHSGSFSGNAGAMGCKVPYLIISRPQTKMADNFENMEGVPTNKYTVIGDCSGYIKAKSVHIINVNATDDELTELNELILSGILI